MNEIKDQEQIGLIKIAVENEESTLLSKFSSFVEELSGGVTFDESVKYQTRIVRHLLVQMAAVMPLASVGTCHCGKELRFKGKKSGLYACCTGNPEHCWKIS